MPETVRPPEAPLATARVIDNLLDLRAAGDTLRGDEGLLLDEILRLQDVIGRLAAAEWTARGDLAEAQAKLAVRERQLADMDAGVIA